MCVCVYGVCVMFTELVYMYDEVAIGTDKL